MWALLVICQLGTVNAPVVWHHWPDVDRASLTRATPCPESGVLIEQRADGATCAARVKPSKTLELEFFPDGSLAAYVSMQDGVRHGTTFRWHPNGHLALQEDYSDGELDGTQRTYREDGTVSEQAHFVRGGRDGLYQRWLAEGRIESGAYRRGLKEGTWIEYRGDTRVEGLYVRGARSGDWNVGADAIVEFENDSPLRAFRFTRDYRKLAAGIDTTWFALAIAGHYFDRRLEVAGIVGLGISAPILQGITQSPSQRTVMVARSLALRPMVLAGVFVLYTLGKAIDSIHCRYRDDDGGCADYEVDFNSTYNWNAVLLFAGGMLVGYDVADARRGEPESVGKVWPSLSFSPIRSGAMLTLSGSL